jgi:CRP-like cAMP-binding protein
MQDLIQYINTIAPLNIEAEDALHKYAQIEHYKKGEFILEEGQRCNKIWFLTNGMVRKFFLVDGKERTCWIHIEKETFTSLSSYSSQKPSDEYLQAYEEVTAISISRANSQKLNQYPAIVSFANALMERAFVGADEYNRKFAEKDAKGKWDLLCEIAPEMVQRAKLGHLASILGMSQETLSRIRRIK